MTYSQLLNILQSATEEELNQNVTVRVFDEYVPIIAMPKTGQDCDVLDPGHLLLITDN
jgi:hypothetical protein